MRDSGMRLMQMSCVAGLRLGLNCVYAGLLKMGSVAASGTTLLLRVSQSQEPVPAAEP